MNHHLTAETCGDGMVDKCAHANTKPPKDHLSAKGNLFRLYWCPDCGRGWATGPHPQVERPQ